MVLSVDIEYIPMWKYALRKIYEEQLYYRGREKDCPVQSILRSWKAIVSTAAITPFPRVHCLCSEQWGSLKISVGTSAI